eukprot:c19467_g1_i1 orf=811-1011(+)
MKVTNSKPVGCHCIPPEKPPAVPLPKWWLLKHKQQSPSQNSTCSFHMFMLLLSPRCAKTNIIWSIK